jgi:3-hydroxyacyl-CoA dehydrogenase/3-hydroxy-2-methylbutyryl-CoA dehydrogenase
LLEEFRQTLLINTIGTFNVSRLSSERMTRRKPYAEGLRGYILNTASIAAFEGQRGQVAYYAASKGGAITSIMLLCLPLARNLALYGIRVCTITPGIIKTPLLNGFLNKNSNGDGEKWFLAQIDYLSTSTIVRSSRYEFGRLVVISSSIIVNPM